MRTGLFSCGNLAPFDLPYVPFPPSHPYLNGDLSHALSLGETSTGTKIMCFSLTGWVSV